MELTRNASLPHWPIYFYISRGALIWGMAEDTYFGRKGKEAPDEERKLAQPSVCLYYYTLPRVLNCHLTFYDW